MNNNDILRKVRYTFDFHDQQMIDIFALANCEVTRPQVSDWLKRDDDEDFVEMQDEELAIFLNGFINLKRGIKEGAIPFPEKRLNNNIIFRKLKIALNLTAEDVLEILALSNRVISKHELSAFFRKADHSKYKACQDQILRNFLHGMQQKYRPK